MIAVLSLPLAHIRHAEHAVAVVQLRASFYSQYARRLASWGYAVVQYDTGLLRIINDRTEVRPVGLLPYLMRGARLPSHLTEIRRKPAWLHSTWTLASTAHPALLLSVNYKDGPESDCYQCLSSSNKHMPAQLRCLDSVLAWLAEENGRPGCYAHDKLELSSLGVVGHSRGAKLAALHLVGALASGSHCTAMLLRHGQLYTPDADKKPWFVNSSSTQSDCLLRSCCPSEPHKQSYHNWCH